MERQKGLTLIEILISAGLAILVIGGGLLLYNNFNESDTTAREGVPGEAITEVGEEIKQEGAEEESMAISEEVEVDTRETYTNEEYGFEIKYPEDFEFGGENPREKLLFSLTDASGENTYEFWIRELNGKTLEAVFEEKLNLEDVSYFEWIKSWGGEVLEENIGQNSWLFVDGSAKFYLDSHYMVPISGHDAYLVVDLDFPEEGEFEAIKKILSSLIFKG